MISGRISLNVWYVTCRGPEDEHELIDTYCNAMNANADDLTTSSTPNGRLGLSQIPSSSPENLRTPETLPTAPSARLPQSNGPDQKNAQVDPEQREELDLMILELGLENRHLQAEYERLKGMR